MATDTRETGPRASVFHYEGQFDPNHLRADERVGPSTVEMDGCVVYGPDGLVLAELAPGDWLYHDDEGELRVVPAAVARAIRDAALSPLRKKEATTDAR